MSRPRILLADDTDATKLIEQALSEYEVHRVHKLHEVKDVLARTTIDLFLIGVHFDDSQSMPLITMIRTDPKYLQTPIVVVRALRSEYAKLLKQTLETMIRLGNVTAYVELEPVPPNLPELVKAAVQDALRCQSQ